MFTEYICNDLIYIDYIFFRYSKTNNTHEIYMGECPVLSKRSCEKK